MENSHLTKVLEISSKFNMKDGHQLKMDKRRRLSNLSQRRKVLSPWMIGSWLCKLGVFRLMLFPKYVKLKSLAIYTTKLQTEHKRLLKLSNKSFTIQLNIHKLTIYTMITIDYIFLMPKQLVFLRTFNKNKRVKILYSLIEVHSTLLQEVKLTILELLLLMIINMKFTMWRKQANASSIIWIKL